MSTKVDEKKLEAFEQALLAGITTGVVNLDQVDNVILQAGFAVTEKEHTEAKPVSKKELALTALAEFVNLNQITNKAGQENLLSAFGKYQVHCFTPDKSNGTSLVSHYCYQQLKAGKTVYLSEVLAYVRQHLPTYSSSGHFNTIKRLLKKAGITLNISKGQFSIGK
jgi:regulator of sigma D